MIVRLPTCFAFCVSQLWSFRVILLLFSKYCEMPEASNIYRKIDVGMGSTLKGSNVLASNIFYKHTNPLGL